MQHERWRLAAPRDRSGEGRVDPGDGVQEGGFSGAVRADHGERTPGGQLEIDAGQGDVVAVADFESLNRERCGHGRRLGGNDSHSDWERVHRLDKVHLPETNSHSHFRRGRCLEL